MRGTTMEKPAWNNEFGPCIRRFGLLAATRTRLRRFFMSLRCFYLNRLWGMDIHPHTAISLKANLDRTNPKGVHVGEGSAISFDAVILAHDAIRRMNVDTIIGKYCQIGARSLIMPGLTIGDHSIIGAGSIVTKNIPPRSIAVGNPAKVIRKDIMTENWGVLTDNGVAVKDAA